MARSHRNKGAARAERWLRRRRGHTSGPSVLSWRCFGPGPDALEALRSSLGLRCCPLGVGSEVEPGAAAKQAGSQQVFRVSGVSPSGSAELRPLVLSRPPALDSCSTTGTGSQAAWAIRISTVEERRRGVPGGASAPPSVMDVHERVGLMKDSCCDETARTLRFKSNSLMTGDESNKGSLMSSSWTRHGPPAASGLVPV